MKNGSWNGLVADLANGVSFSKMRNDCDIALLNNLNTQDNGMFWCPFVLRNDIGQCNEILQSQFIKILNYFISVHVMQNT